MVTAGNGTMTFQSLSSPKTYTVSFYSSDVVGAPLTFNLNGLAGSTSPTFWKTPEDVRLVDIAFTSSNTVAVAWIVTKDGGIVSGQVFQIAAYLNSLNNRPPIAVNIRGGSNFSMQQA